MNKSNPAEVDRTTLGGEANPGANRKKDRRTSVTAAISGAIALTIGLVGWWVVSRGEGNANQDATGPIATLSAPDFHALLIDPENPNRVLFGSHAGLQESNDGGYTWASGTLANADAMNLATSPEDSQTLYVAGHDVFLMSRDGGQSWQPTPNNLPGSDLHAFAQDPSEPNRLYTLVVGSGIFTSADGGSVWEPVTPPPGFAGTGALATNGPDLYVVMGEEVQRSSDRGTTWETLPATPGGAVLNLAVSPVDPNILYAGTASGIAQSLDGGASWVERGPAGIPVYAVAVSPIDANQLLFVSDSGGVYRSNNGGATWEAPR